MKKRITPVGQTSEFANGFHFLLVDLGCRPLHFEGSMIPRAKHNARSAGGERLGLVHEFGIQTQLRDPGKGLVSEFIVANAAYQQNIV